MNHDKMSLEELKVELEVTKRIWAHHHNEALNYSMEQYRLEADIRQREECEETEEESR